MQVSKKKTLHITFAYPYGNGFHPEFLQSIIGLLLYEVPKHPDKRILGSILKKGSCYVDNNRDAIVNEFLNVTKDDWLLMVDTDIQFGPNILELLVEHIIKNPKAKIIAGRVNLANGLPVFYNHNPKTGMPQHQPFVFQGLRPFDLVGAGILCINRDALISIIKDLGHGHIFQKIITNEMLTVGDDFSFCLRANRCKFKIYGAWNVYGLHWKVMPCHSRYPEEHQL